MNQEPLKTVDEQHNLKHRIGIGLHVFQQYKCCNALLLWLAIPSLKQ